MDYPSFRPNPNNFSLRPGFLAYSVRLVILAGKMQVDILSEIVIICHSLYVDVSLEMMVFQETRHANILGVVR